MMIQVSSSSRWQAARRFAANTRAAHVESAQTHRAQELLSDWRKSDEGRDGLVWSPKEGPVSIASCPPDSEHRISYEAIRGPDTDAADVHEASLEAYAHRVLNSPQPLLKAELTHKAWREYRAGTIKIFSETPIATPLPDAPARPAKPALVPARQIPLLKKSPLSPPAYTLHNLAHVELNAIDLAWDSMARFAPLRLPDGFYEDFCRVADDESRHLGWTLQRLHSLGTRYGDMPAHNLLWDGCIASATDVRERLAVVPMSQEARGLDAGGRLADRLVGWGDNVSAAIVARISDEERQHVAVGTYWFSLICDAMEQDGKQVFVDTLTTLTPELLRPPFNDEAREAVGLPKAYYDETLWSDEDRRRIDAVREERKLANPDGSGMAASSASSPSSALRPIDANMLRQRLAAFLQFEDE